MAIIENLYPPIVMDTMPAFIRTKTCRVYFSLSIYTAASDIKNVQISLVNQKTNLSALKRSLYPAEIKITNLNYDETKKDNYNYYIQIAPEDLEAESFGLNQFYKVQLRFTSKDVPTNPPSNGKIANWLYENINYFSEWSKVCLIKGIEQPKIEVNFSEDGPNTFDLAPTQFVGKLTYQPKNTEQQTEHLDSYIISIYAPLFNDPIYKSDIIRTDSFNPNEINFELLYNFDNQINYVLYFSYKTNNSYTDTKKYVFSINPIEVPQIPIKISAIAQPELGYIDINLESNEGELFQGNLLLKRASSKNNFAIWDIIRTIRYPEERKVILQLQDLSIESGVWYKYRVQKEDMSEDGAPVQTEHPVICVFDDIFIVHDDIQLKIQFNPTVSDFKYNVMESQQTTLGSKFPYIRINGNSKYKSFSLGGLISSLSDRTDWYQNYLNNQKKYLTFMNKEKAYGNSVELYQQYNIENNISDYLDVLYERAFREKVYDFLYGNNVKLFKSTTEGNILIRLSNVSFQPMEQLGRGIYSFTATATEVDESNVENYLKYNIIYGESDLETLTLAPGLSLNRRGVLTLEAYGVQPEDENAVALLLENILIKGGRWK